MLRRLVLGAAVLLVAACGLSVTGVAENASPSSIDEAGTTTSEAGTAGDDDDDDDDAAVAVLRDAGSVVVDAGALFDGGTPSADAGACKRSALIVVDDGDQSSADGLHDYMLLHGFTSVYESTSPVSQYRGGGDAADPFAQGVVVLLLGRDAPLDMPLDGQTSIAGALQSGVGFVTEEWIVYDMASGALTGLTSFSLATPGAHGYSFFAEQTVTVTFTDTLFWDGTGANAHFTMQKKASYAQLVPRPTVQTNATISKHPGVLSTQTGSTRIAQTAIGVNDYSSDEQSAKDNSLATDDNVKLLFTNMALWAAHCR